MKLSKHKHSTSAEMNMTPMIDIVFLLIIFFMTVSQISKINKEQVDLPQLKGTEEQEPTTITINIKADGDIIVSGKTTSVPQLVGMMTDEILALGDDTSKLTIVLRADRNGMSRTVNEIVTALGRLGITQVRFAVEATDS